MKVNTETQYDIQRQAPLFSSKVLNLGSGRVSYCIFV